MPAQFINTTMLDPTQSGLQQQIAQERASQLAAMLQQQAMEPVTPVTPGAPISWTQGLAKLMQGWSAGKAQNRSDDLRKQIAATQLDAFNKMLGTGQNPGMSVQGGAPQGGAQALGNALGAAQGGQQQGGALPSLTGDLGRDRIMASQLGMPAYIEQLSKRYDWTDQQKNDAYRGISPDQSRTMAMAEALKGSVVPGSSSTLKLDQNGNPVSSPVAGLAENMAAVTGANTAATHANTPIQMPTSGGGTRYAYPTDVIGPPPAMRNGQEPQGTAPAAASPAPAGAPKDKGGKFDGAPMLSITNRVGQSPTTFDQEVMKGAAAKHNELVTQFGQEADAADQRIRLGYDAAAALANAETGPASGVTNAVRGFAVQFGLATPEQADKYTSTTTLNKYLIQNALQDGKALFGSRYTQSEVGIMLNQANASGKMSAPVITELTTQSMLKGMYEKQRAQDYAEYAASGHDPQRFQSWYASHHSMQDFATKNYDSVRKQVGDYMGKNASPQATQANRKTIDGKTYEKRADGWYAVD